MESKPPSLSPLFLTLLLSPQTVYRDLGKTHTPSAQTDIWMQAYFAGRNPIQDRTAQFMKITKTKWQRSDCLFGPIQPLISLSDEIKYPFAETIHSCSKCSHFGVALRKIRDNGRLLQSSCVPQEAEAINQTESYQVLMLYFLLLILTVFFLHILITFS